VIWHVVNANNTGLFQHAIAQSPAPWGAVPLQLAELQFQKLLEEVGVSNTTSPEAQIEALRAVPASDLLNATTNLSSLYPVLDDVLVKGDPIAQIEAGDFVNLTSMIIGTNDDEGWVNGSFFDL